LLVFKLKNNENVKRGSPIFPDENLNVWVVH